MEGVLIVGEVECELTRSLASAPPTALNRVSSFVIHADQSFKSAVASGLVDCTIISERYEEWHEVRSPA